MTTFGDQVFQFGGATVSGPLSTGPAIFCKGTTGSDGNRGNRPDRSVKTFNKAHTLVKTDQNSVIYIVSEGNGASATTIRIDPALTFSKDGVKVQGIASGGRIGQRARISNTSSMTAAAALLTWSANNSSMSDIHLTYGLANTAALGCINVTGERNAFYRCHFAGMATTTQDKAGGYSLRVTGDENYFEDCVIGIDTLEHGTEANSELLIPASGLARRTIFRNCTFLTYANANTHQLAIIGASGSIDRFVLFDNCTFINSSQFAGLSINLLQAIEVGNAPGGTIILKNCASFGAIEWEDQDRTAVLAVGTYGDFEADGNNDTLGIGTVPVGP